MDHGVDLVQAFRIGYALAAGDGIVRRNLTNPQVEVGCLHQVIRAGQRSLVVVGRAEEIIRV
jgi:hypothetical protein